MSQGQVPLQSQREINDADPYRWTDNELAVLVLEILAVAALTPPFVISVFMVFAVLIGTVWFLAKLDSPKR